ncbi:MAG: hypothetical protein KKD63_11040 [Proteobacteria bacterium]|nr:hypothetical protein [Desulfobulbaceae bacterium]MBU4153406.1 hypothetical protein [Pseudomonadota bacterium]
MLSLSTNLVTRNATTQFVGYDFNSMVNFNGTQIVANDSGLFVLGGNSDEGVDIDAYFQPVLSDFGDAHPKRLRFIYLGFEADGQITVTTSDGLPEEAAESETKTITPRFVGQQRVRIPVTRALHGRYWSFRIANKNGADFSVDSIMARIIRRSHGITQHS